MSRIASVHAAEPRRSAAERKLARIVQPTMTERFFDENDIIVSKTNPKGHLTYVNRTFMAISDYSESELLGQPHSLIRHPDMPRAVFKLFWARLQEKREVFAYVKNMARNGDFYWVLAHATPSIGPSGELLGYHSNRRVPDRRVIGEVVVPFYHDMKRIEDAEPDRRVSLEQSWRQLNALLQQRGVDYDEFVLGL